MNSRSKESKTAAPSPLTPTFDSEGPSLSEINPLFNPLDLPDSSSVDAFKSVTQKLVDRYGGVRPDAMKAMIVTSLSPNAPPAYRFIARFEVTGLTKPKIKHLEELVKYTYGSDSRTTKNADGIELQAVRYPPADIQTVDETVNTRLEGWYMGPNTTSLDSLHTGLYLFRDVGVTNSKNFLQTTQVKRPKFVVEIREADLFQTDLASLVVETATILGKGKPVDYGQLLYDVYYELIRAGLKKHEEGFEIEDILKPVRRGLIYPLANPKLAGAIDQEPESALLCGVPGTGKSLAARQLLYEDTGLFVIPMDPMQVAQDIGKPPEKRQIIPRISQVKRLSQRPVVLQLDDVEKLFDKRNETSSALLNLMAGVQEQGFYVLASTNEPEQIDVALLQPQRLGIRVYCGLPSQQARLHILEMHTPSQTPETASPLFSSDEVREIILGYVAKNTESFPPRQLAKIATNAKAIFIERIIQLQGRVRGLTEADLKGATFDKRATVKRDEEIKEFVVHHDKGRAGFHQVKSRSSHGFDEVRKRIAAEEASRIVTF